MLVADDGSSQLNVKGTHSQTSRNSNVGREQRESERGVVLFE